MNLLPVVAILLLTSCNKDDNSNENDQVALNVSVLGVNEGDENPELVSEVKEGVTGNLIKATLERLPATKKGAETLEDGTTYRVIAFKEGDITAAGYVNHGDFVMGTASAVSNFNIPANATYSFVCYSLNSKQALPAFDKNALDIIANSATDDLLYVSFDKMISETDKTLSFSFNRQFSQITVIADATDLNENITEITTSLTPNHSATLSFVTGALTASSTSADRIISWGAITAGQIVTSSPCTVFTNGGNVALNIPSVTIGGTARTNLKATFESNMLPVGKYTLRLKFKRNLIWAKGNLICSGEIYRIASTQEYYSGTADGGDYFCWNTLSPKATSSTNITENYDVATDPCTKVNPEGTWRMPTKREFDALISSGSVWGTKNGVNGRYYGTTKVPASGFEDDYIFLPAAGYRIDSTTFNFTANEGAYWTATPSYSLCFRNSDTLVWVTAPLDRNYGFFVRCVSDKKVSEEY